jgi:hypothetical protein
LVDEVLVVQFEGGFHGGPEATKGASVVPAYAEAEEAHDVCVESG